MGGYSSLFCSITLSNRSENFESENVSNLTSIILCKDFTIPGKTGGGLPHEPCRRRIPTRLFYALNLNT
jgi:hypothetical protein